MAPRVLVDATAVPADRGGVGRYVDGLLAALGAAGADLAVVCQRSDAERYAPLAPHAVDRARPGRDRAPPGPAGLGADRAAAGRPAGRPRRSCTRRTTRCRCGSAVPVVVTIHDATFFTSPEAITASQGHVLPLGHTHRAAPRHPGDRAEQGDPRRADPGARRRPDDRSTSPTTGSIRSCSTRRPTPSKARVAARLGLHGSYVAFLGALEPRKNVPTLIRGWVEAVSWRDDAARAGARRRQRLGRRRRRRDRRGAEPPARGAPGLPALRRPARLPRRARWSSPSRATARASACRCSRRWRAAPRC